MRNMHQIVQQCQSTNNSVKSLIDCQLTPAARVNRRPYGRLPGWEGMVVYGVELLPVRNCRD
jgi:hypothetical protein